MRKLYPLLTAFVVGLLITLVVLWAGSSAALVNRTFRFNATGATTSAINCTGATLIVISSAQDFGQPGFFGDAPGNEYHNLTTFHDSANVNQLFLSYSFDHFGSALSGLSTITWSSTGNNCALFARCYSGTLTTASVLDTSTGFGCTGTCASVQPGSITPAGNGELFVAGAASPQSGDTINSGFTNFDLITGSGAAADLIQGALAAVNPTFSDATNSRKIAAMAAFKPASYGSGNNMPPIILTMLPTRNVSSIRLINQGWVKAK